MGEVVKLGAITAGVWVVFWIAVGVLFTGCAAKRPPMPPSTVCKWYTTQKKMIGPTGPEIRTMGQMLCSPIDPEDRVEERRR